MQNCILTPLAAARTRTRGDDTGQASAEYALVLLGAAAVALLVTAWATHTDAVGNLLDAVLKHLLGRVQ
ncbi:MAG TPA: DUF4244 domain-containing protein [Acidimicrobiales bacterium]|nr:DUF4244 domain-containing protein [Acidimicrobiales bacterium]